MRLEEKPIFVTSIYEGEFDEIDHQKILEEVYEIKNRDSGRKMPEHAGWHSNQIYVEDIEKTTEILKVVQAMYGSSMTVAQSWGYNEKELIFNACWLNINGQGNFNEPHRHPWTHLSSVYYIKAEEDCGDIWFMRDGRLEDYLPPSRTENHHTVPRVAKPARTGSFYIFPSYLDHKVDPNLSGEDRISMAFNFSFQ